MRLTDLDPRWLTMDGARVGFVFRCPVRGHKGHWLSCFSERFAEEVQDMLIDRELGEDAMCARCNPSHGWTIQGDFERLTVTPSINGGELPYAWHGHITNGEIVGGLPT